MAQGISTLYIVILFAASVSLQEKEILYEGSWIKCDIIGPNRECQLGRYNDNCGFCTRCKEIGDVCESSVQCCGTENMACRNFSVSARPQCLCLADYQYDATVNRCYLPVTIPQQLLLIAVYSVLAVIISLGITATILHVLRSQLGLCVRHKEHRTLEMDIEDQEIDSVIHQTRPPPYSPAEDHPSVMSSTGAVAAGLELALPVALHHASPRDPPPAYEELPRLNLSENNNSPHTTVTIMEYEPMMSTSQPEVDSLEEVTIPHIVITPPPASGEFELTFLGNSPVQVPEIIVSPSNLTEPTEDCQQNNDSENPNSCFMCELDSTVTSGVSYNEQQNTCTEDTCLFSELPAVEQENGNSLEVNEVNSISGRVPFVKIYDPSSPADDAKPGENSSLVLPMAKFNLTKYLNYQKVKGYPNRDEDGAYTNPACDM